MDGAEECVDMLEEYGLSRDDLFEVGPSLVVGVLDTIDLVVFAAAVAHLIVASS